MVYGNINCVWNDRGAWCKNKNIKRSLFGFGVRSCIEYPPLNDYCCGLKIEHKKPNIVLPKPPKIKKGVLNA